MQIVFRGGNLHELLEPIFWLKKKKKKRKLSICQASVAQLDARLTGDQEVAGSTPTEVGNILSWRLIMKYFLWSFSPIRWFK